MAEPILRMNLNDWDYAKPVGNRYFTKKVAKEIAHIEKYDFFFVKEKDKPLRMVKKQKPI